MVVVHWLLVLLLLLHPRIPFSACLPACLNSGRRTLKICKKENPETLYCCMYLSAMNSSLSCPSSPSITPRNRSCSFSSRIEQHGFLVLVRNKKSLIQKRGILGTSSCMERFGFSANFLRGSSNLVVSCYRESGSSDNEEKIGIASGVSTAEEGNAVSNEVKFNASVGDPVLRSYLPNSAKMSVGDQGFYLLAFVACTTCVAFTSFVVAAIPTFYAIGRAATSLSKLADTACAELPSTMAAIRLSGMEISDLTLELSDLSQEIADGVNKSSQAVQAAEAGIRQIGALARDRTMSMASKPINSIQPVVAGAAEKTSRAVGHAKRTLLNIISRGEFRSDDEENATDRMDE